VTSKGSCRGAKQQRTRPPAAQRDTPPSPPQEEEVGCKTEAGAARKLEEIRGKKMQADGTVLYLAHWQGCDTDDDTWEHAAGLGSDEWLVSEWEAEQADLCKPACAYSTLSSTEGPSAGAHEAQAISLQA